MDLALTDDGKKAARAAADRELTEGGGTGVRGAARAEADIPPILADVHARPLRRCRREGQPLAWIGRS